MMRRRSFFASLLLSVALNIAPAAEPPGIIIDRSPDPARIYIGCPGIAVLPNGDYVASHSWFGPGTTNDRMTVFSSTDSGNSMG